MGYIDHPRTPVKTSSISRSAEPGAAPFRDVILEVIDRSTGAVLFTEVLSRGAHWPAHETVFVLRNRLYYVKDSTTLAAIRLGDAES